MTEQVVFNKITQPSAYLGASTSYKNKRKGLIHGDPDSIAAMEIANLQMRSADLVRNNGYAKTGLTKYMTYLAAVKVNWTNSKGKKHKKMQKFWEEFVANPNLDGHGTFANTQSIINSSQFITGNAYTRMMVQRTGNTNTVPLKLQAIPTEMHDIFYNGGAEEDNVKHGIKFDNSKPVTYYFRKGIYNHLWLGADNPFSVVSIPAEDIVHQFIRESPGQWIGLPLLTSVILNLYEVDELIEATVAKQKAAQAIAWIIENTNPMALTPTGAPGVETGENGEDKIVFKASGGNTQYLNKGESIKFYQSTDIGKNLPLLIQAELRRIAGAIGVPYHSLTGDTGDLAFSSLRAISVEFRQRLEYIHHFYTIPLSIVPITNRFKELAILYSSKVSDATPTFQLPRWYGVDDLKDTQADVLELNYGLGTLQGKLDERHLTFEEAVESAGQIKELEAALGRPLGGVSSTHQSNNTKPNTNSTSL